MSDSYRHTALIIQRHEAFMREAKRVHAAKRRMAKAAAHRLLPVTIVYDDERARHSEDVGAALAPAGPPAPFFPASVQPPGGALVSAPHTSAFSPVAAAAAAAPTTATDDDDDVVIPPTDDEEEEEDEDELVDWSSEDDREQHAKTQPGAEAAAAGGSSQ